MVREATINDFPDIYRMAQAFYKEAQNEKLYGAPFDEDSAIAFLISFVNDENKVLIIDDNGKGMILGVLIPHFFNRRLLLAQEMAWFVEKENRGGLLGGRLYKAFEKWSKEQGATAIVMGALSRTSGKKVDRFYRKCGMVKMETMYGKQLWQ